MTMSAAQNEETTATRPEWSLSVQSNDTLTVREEYLGRGGQQGEVLWANDSGVSLDFYCDRDGNPGGVPSQEFWLWSEIDPDSVPARTT